MKLTEYRQGLTPEVLQKIRRAWTVYRETFGWEMDVKDAESAIKRKQLLDDNLETWYSLFGRKFHKEPISTQEFDSRAKGTKHR